MIFSLEREEVCCVQVLADIAIVFYLLTVLKLLTKQSEHSGCRNDKEQVEPACPTETLFGAVRLPARKNQPFCVVRQDGHVIDGSWISLAFKWRERMLLHKLSLRVADYETL